MIISDMIRIKLPIQFRVEGTPGAISVVYPSSVATGNHWRSSSVIFK